MKLLFVAISSFFVFTSLDQADSSYYDKIVLHSRIRAKDKGPNVCALQQVVGTKKKYFSTCRNWHQRSICMKKALVLYECCPGYMRLDGGRGCPAVSPIDHVYGTLAIVGATNTQNYADRSNLRREIEGEGTFTIFAPSDDAWMLLDAEVRSALLSNVNIELLNALHYHMVDHRLLTKDVNDELTVPSMYNDLNLHINHYRNGIVTVNCARIITANQIATNGIVHVIDRVITAVGSNLEETIEATDELSSFRAAAAASGLFGTLGTGGHYTIFAPTNEAFDKLPREVLERILSDDVAMKALLNYHILKSVHCSESIMSGATYATLEGTNIEIGCDGDSLTVNGERMVNRKDIVATNGVIHLINKVLIPDAAMQILDLVSIKQSTFSDLVKDTGLSAAFTDTDYTLLVPFNEAFNEDIMSFDQRILKVILQNHILKVKVVLNQLYNGQILETVGGKFLRVFVYRTAVCIENSCMVRGSRVGRNGVLHTIRKVIMPSEYSMLQILRDDPRFTIFLTLIESVGLTELLTEGRDWTLFVPTNDVFESLTSNELEELTRDKNALRHILLYHLLKGVYIGDGIEYGVTNVLKSYQGSRLMIKLVNNTMLVNNVKTKESDLLANNGVIHVVNSLLFPKDLPVGSDFLQRILTKIIKYIEIKFIPGYTYTEMKIPIFKTEVREFTRIVTTKPEINVISGRITHSGRIEAKVEAADLAKLIEGGTQYSKFSRTIEGDPNILDDVDIQKLLQGETTRKITHFNSRIPAGLRRSRHIRKLRQRKRKPVRA
ncbi:periostin isoform X2 [Amblyraja radiata]|uniref:periostin isoform X2 n=1 Tax=Amblyraja radiata TaxID=386614 RepID=UPI001402555F|nr:periostin isoform X2 [Amblyraja radiata]